jgi:uncharacterized protein YfaS (alpha-2-macroglobulin family)
MTRSIKFQIFALIAIATLFLTLTQEAAQPKNDEVVKITRISEKTIALKFHNLPQKRGTLRVVIKNLDGNIIGQGAVKYSKSSAAITIPASINKETLAEYIVAYKLDTGQKYRQRSLFHLVDKLETIFLAQRQYFSGSRASLRVITRNRNTQSPLEGVKISISLINDQESENILFEGHTIAKGTLNALVKFPQTEGSYKLKIVADAAFGKDEIIENIKLVSARKILLTTDKPMYQPGHIIHMRALVLAKPNIAPVKDEVIVLEVEDSKGNKVFKKELKTDKFGVAAADFRLASELNQGRYKVRAKVGKSEQEKTVTVEKYVLPKFKINLKADKKYYRPGDTASGKVQVDYFFGKPVSGGKVQILFSKFDVGFEQFATLEGTLDENGFYQFEQKLPDYFVGQPLGQGKAFVKVDVKVIDNAEHKETITKNLPVVESSIMVAAVPESGSLIPSVTNEIFIVTTYPNAEPAATTLEIEPLGIKLTTDLAGFGSFDVVPENKPVILKISGSDEQGNRFSREITLTPEKQGTQSILLRPDKAIYSVGGKMQVSLHSTKKRGTVYLDIVKDNQTMLTKTVELSQSTAQTDIDLDPSLAGTIVISGYIIAADGNIVRDTRLVFVNPADELAIQISSDSATYLPGADAAIDFTVTDSKGSPVLLVLGVIVVDEAVYALQEMQPGMEKIYFYLEKELLKPRYEIHAYDIGDVLKPQPKIESADVQTRENAAKVLFAAAEEIKAHDISVNTYERDSKGEGYQKYMAGKLMKRHEKIARAFEKFSRKARKRQERYLQKIDWDEKKPLTLEKLIELRYLIKKDIIDPWGNQFQIEGRWCISCVTYHNIKLISNGPDGIKGTNDDFEIAPDIFEGRRVKMLAGNGRARGRLPMAKGVADDFAMVEEAEALPSASKEAKGQAPAVRIRKYFPETLLFKPAVITDENGKASITIKMADSITTWRMTSMASSLTGALGSATFPIKVFQEFFIDIDFPVSLTQNDEVSVPIAIYNYLTTPQTIRLKAEAGDWFQLLDEPERTIELQPNQVTVEYFTIKVERIGTHTFTVFGHGDKRSDAIRRSIEVEPDGKEHLVTETGRIEGVITKTIRVPENAIEDASKIFVKIYPGVFSQVVEGMDNLLRMPFGCFEQTSSVTYPNVLVIDYMKATDNITPEIQMKAEGFINTGYQRLLSYEVEGGGFSWFGNPPAHNILTSYGLMEFYDMSKVFEIDENVIVRTQNWLASLQKKDGSWEPSEGGIAEGAIDAYRKDKLRSTAYIMLALSYTGYNGAEVAKAADYIENNMSNIKDNFTLAMSAYAFMNYQPKSGTARELIGRLLEEKVEENKIAYWKAGGQTSMYGRGDSADIETTAIACQALILDGKHAGLISKISDYLIQKKDPHGTWGTTQATVQALKALLLSIRESTQRVDGVITIKINGENATELVIDNTNDEILQIVDLKKWTTPGNNKVEIAIKGEGSMFYQIVGRYYLPYTDAHVAEKEPLTIEVEYDKTELAQNDIVTCSVSVTNNRPAAAKMIIVDLGMPPGFTLMSEDFTKLVQNKTIQKFDVTGRQIIVYLDEIGADKTINLSYRLMAKYPLKAKTSKSTVYEYYDPSVRNESAPQQIVVTKN